MDKIIKFEGISKKFQLFWEDVVIFEQIDLDIDRNELVLLYGPSGSGKTTLLNLLTGLLEADEGDIQVTGLYLELIDDKEKADFRSNYLGIVFQENNLVSTLTVKENIVLFQELCGIEEEDSEEKIDKLLEKLKIDHRKESFPAQLSGGEKKRVAIARALSNDPYILILDEPTGNLDCESVDQLCELIRDLFLTTDITIVVASHDQKMMDIATSIYKIGSKSVVLEGVHAERKKDDTIKYRPIDSLEKMREEEELVNVDGIPYTEEEILNMTEEELLLLETDKKEDEEN
ncbi:MAG: ATP-binding cassette domain-containing protein [Candidatus Heimdallarchaeota archaeon]|nr:ATP-binding cassette domain-containing protein [Candidatus Heimdallarchaeota archaeon]MCK4877533.1 ATP-binding cassette domain-containing protein [Candidatus Heimdallarchaeota archaeon]